MSLPKPLEGSVSASRPYILWSNPQTSPHMGHLSARLVNEAAPPHTDFFANETLTRRLALSAESVT